RDPRLQLRDLNNRVTQIAPDPFHLIDGFPGRAPRQCGTAVKHENPGCDCTEAENGEGQSPVEMLGKGWRRRHQKEVPPPTSERTRRAAVPPRTILKTGSPVDELGAGGKKILAQMHCFCPDAKSAGCRKNATMARLSFFLP